MESLTTYPPLPPCDALSTSGSHVTLQEKLFKGIRLGGRKLIEVRPLSLQANFLHSGASGSAYIKQGDTKVITVIYGPLPSNKNSEYDRGSICIEFSLTPYNGKPSSVKERESKEKYIKRKLLEAIEPIVLLEKYPRSSIDIVVTVIEDDGGAFATSLTCIGLALIDAGIHVTDIVVGTSTYAISEPNLASGGFQSPLYIVDFDIQEEKAFETYGQCTTLHLGYCLGRSALCFLHAYGPHLCTPHVAKLLSIGESACRAIGQEIRQYLRELQAYSEKYKSIIQF